MFGVLILWVNFFLVLVNLYILLVVEYVSKYIETRATRTNKAQVVLDFIRTHIFNRFGIPKPIISDCDTHFCNCLKEALLRKYHDSSDFHSLSPSNEWPS
jgi:hypothetical protein